MRLKNKVHRAKKVKGDAERPRLAVYRSLKHISAQIIDDESGKTLASAHSFKLEKKAKSEMATLVGNQLAVEAVKKGIKKVVFDRRNRRYHGRIKALADAARSAGLDF